MAGLTLDHCETQLQKYLDAETKVLKNQEVWVDGEKMTFADLPAIQNGIAIWDARIKKLTRAGRLSVTEVIPR